MEIKVNINTRAIAMGIVRSLAHSLHQQVTDQAVVRFGPAMGQPLSQFFSFGMGQPFPPMPAFSHFPQHPGMMQQRPYAGGFAAGPHGHRYGFEGHTEFSANPRVAEDGMATAPVQENQNVASNPNEPPKNQFTYEQLVEQFCNDPHVVGAVERVLVKQLETYAQLAAQEPTPMPRTF